MQAISRQLTAWKGHNKADLRHRAQDKEVDQLLRECPELRGLIREVHPEVSFCELVGKRWLTIRERRRGARSA
jgi:predicted RNase H-like nuclease